MREHQIFSYLHIRDLLTLGQVCRSWREIGNDQHLWKRIYHQIFPSPYSQIQHGDYKWKVTCKLREAQFIYWRNKHSPIWNKSRRGEGEEKTRMIRCMLKGDDRSGKTSLARALKYEAYLNNRNIASGDEDTDAPINLGHASLHIVDTDNWRSSAIFLHWVDVVVLCLPADEPDPVGRIKRAVEGIRYHCPTVSIILCLTKIDLRDEEGKGRRNSKHRVSFHEGVLFSYYFDLCSYVEVSALQMKHVGTVLREITSVVLGDEQAAMEPPRLTRRSSIDFLCRLQ